MDDFMEALRRLYIAKANALEAAMAQGLIRRGVSEAEAHAAARECSVRMLRNGVITGAVTTVIVGAIGTPVAAAFAGGSAATLAGYHTFLQSEACRDARRLSDMDVQSAVDRILNGF